MAHALSTDALVVTASAAHIGTAGTMTATAVDGRGFDRACFIIQTGAAENTATLDAQITDCATSGGSYANTAGTAVTQLTTPDAGKILVIDIPVKAARPFMKTLIVTGTAAFVNGAVCVLYRGTRSVVAPTAEQTITL